MRKLTVKRHSSFIGRFVKAKIYIEDNYSAELVINGVPCRKLGELKNNEEKTFDIGDEQAKVYVIADKLSKEYCNDFYQLAEGQEDVVLTGKNTFNLAGGNAFRFDNNHTAEALKNRKNNSKKGVVVLCVAVIVGVLIGFCITAFLFPSAKVEAKTFSDEGISITLTNQFKKTDMENYTLCYDSKNVAVFVIKEPFTLMEGLEDYTLEAYGKLVAESNGRSPSALKETNGLLGFAYTFNNPETNKEYKYYIYVYKSKDAFWIVQFATETKNVEALSATILDYAKSVCFE